MGYPMALSSFAVLVVTVALAVAWGAVAVALRQSQQMTMEKIDGEDGWTITETGAEPGWVITPAHMRMW
jgi:hypothetical protein